MHPCISVRYLVRPFVCFLVMLSSNLVKNGFLHILDDLDIAGQGGKSDKNVGVTRRKEWQGGRSNKEEGATVK